MSDETKMTEAEANTEEQPANETPTEDSGVAEHLATAEQDAPLPEESAAESAPQVVAEAVAEPVAEAAAEPVAEAVAEPEAEAVAEPEAEAVAEPEAEAAAEPVAEAVAEPVAEAVAEPVAEAVAEPVAEAVAEPVAEAVAEPEAEAVAEPEAEAVAEPEAEAVAESESEGDEKDDASAEVDAGSSKPEQVAPTFNRVEGPAIFNRAKQGNQRRNPRHVGNDVRIDEIGYKNVQVLSRFVDNYGRIHNRRKTRVTAKMQRKVTRAIKRARHLALMPYTGEHIRITGRRS